MALADLSDNQLREFLRWVATPDDSKSEALFNAHALMPDWLSLMSRIDGMSRTELIEECLDVFNEFGLEEA